MKQEKKRIDLPAELHARAKAAAALEQVSLTEWICAVLLAALTKGGEHEQITNRETVLRR